MPKQLQLTIPKPCHENWDAMTQEMQGRHCTVCSKTVLDFTLMSDGQILDAIQKAGNNACGRFTNDQLDRPLIKPLEPKWYMAGVWKYMLSSFILFKGVQLKAQVKPGVTLCAKPKKDTIPLRTPHRTMGIVAFQPKVQPLTYTGVVESKDGQPIAFATVTIVGKKIAVSTNESGEFTIKALPNEEIQITSVGYEMKKLKLTQKENIIILEAYQKMGEVVVIAGGIRSSEVYIEPTDKTKINYTIKDITTNTVVPNASIVIERNGKIGTSFADGDGTFQVKRVKDNDKINITVSSVGYKTKSLCIKGADLEKGKLKEEILLEREVKKEEDVIVVINRDIRMSKIVMGSTATISAKDLEVKKDSIVSEFLCPFRGGTITIFNEEKFNYLTEISKINTYPNPIQANQPLQIQYKSTVEEMVMLQLTTFEGKILLMQKEKAIKGLNTYTVKMPANVAPQTAVLQLMNSKGKWIATEKIAIQ